MPEIDQSTLEQLQRDASAAKELKEQLETANRLKQEAEDAAKAKDRQYQSVQGNLVTVTKERERLEGELATLSTNTELTKAQIAAEKQDLESKIQEATTKEAQHQQQLSQKDEELEVLRLVANEYPELADWYSKGRIVPNGKKGDELKTFLAGWQQDLEESNLLEKRKGGKTPTPPPGGQLAMTYDQVQDKKIEIGKTKGYGSQEYRELVQIEEQLFKEGKYKR